MFCGFAGDFIRTGLPPFQKAAASGGALFPVTPGPYAFRKAGRAFVFRVGANGFAARRPAMLNTGFIACAMTREARTLPFAVGGGTTCTYDTGFPGPWKPEVAWTGGPAKTLDVED